MRYRRLRQCTAALRRHVDSVRRRASATPPQAQIDGVRIVVYTAITGEIDTLRQPIVHNPNLEYVCFSDTAIEAPGVWKVAPADTRISQSRRRARRHKLMPHEYFPDAEYSIWLDGTFSMAIDPVEAIQRWLVDSDIALIRHPQRDCIYLEAQACKQSGKDDPTTIDEQMRRYREAGYPAHNGMVASGVLLRRHTPLIERLNEAWWAELAANSLRDQLSFNYVADRLGVAYSTIPGGYWDNPWFVYSKHVQAVP